MAIFDQLKGIFKNPKYGKFAIGGVVLAAGLGGYVILKRKQTTGSSSTGSQDGSTTGGATTWGYSPALADTTATDLGSYLGNWQQQEQNMFAEYTKNLTDALSHLQGIGGNGSTPPPTTGWAQPGSPGYQPKPTGSVSHIVKSDETTWEMIVNRYFANGGHPTTNAKAIQAWSDLHGGQALRPGAKIVLPTSSPGILN